jgi:uncharacterized alpha-E superfamily protein
VATPTLSRIADSLIWIGRYVERAETSPGFLDVGRSTSGNASSAMAATTPTCRPRTGAYAGPTGNARGIEAEITRLRRPGTPVVGDRAAA